MKPGAQEEVGTLYYVTTLTISVASSLGNLCHATLLDSDCAWPNTSDEPTILPQV